MTIMEILTLLLPPVSSVIISSIVAFILYRMNKMLISGDMEMRLREYINTTKIRLSDMIVLKAQSDNRNEELMTAIINAINVAIQENINAYEEACAKYLDRKVDKKRFKKCTI